MTKLRNVFQIAGWITAVLLTGCGGGHFEWQGPTDNFRSLDANSDGAVDRFEWEVAHGSEFPLTLGFRYSDCDSDGRVDWHEYFVGFMHLEHCPGTYLYETAVPPQPDATSVAATTHEDDTLGEDWRAGPLLVRTDENVQIYALPPEERDVPTVLRRKLPSGLGHHTEEDLSAAASQRLRFTSGRLEDRLLVARYDPVEKIPGNEVRAVYPHASCEIANDNTGVRITMVDLQVVWRVRGRGYRSRWLKPLRIEPGKAQSLDVWFGSAVDAVECRLLHFRGQTVGR